MGMSFFDMLWVEQVGRSADHAQNAANAALADAEFLGATVGDLRAELARQRRELTTLRSLVGVLAGVLRDTGVVDAAVLDYRLEAALEEAELSQQAAAAGQDTILCGACGKRVPRTKTVITADGVRCEACSL